jgi:hypothetical protein
MRLYFCITKGILVSPDVSGGRERRRREGEVGRKREGEREKERGGGVWGERGGGGYFIFQVPSICNFCALVEKYFLFFSRLRKLNFQSHST